MDSGWSRVNLPLGIMVAKDGNWAHLVLQRIVRNRAPLQETIKHSLGVIGDIGDHQFLAFCPMDNDPAVAANAVFPYMFELLPADAGGGAAALDQALTIQ